MGSAPSGIAIGLPCSADTIAALSVSQKRNVPPASAMHFSSIAKKQTPPGRNERSDVRRKPLSRLFHHVGSRLKRLFA